MTKSQIIKTYRNEKQNDVIAEKKLVRKLTEGTTLTELICQNQLPLMQKMILILIIASQKNDTVNT